MNQEHPALLDPKQAVGVAPEKFAVALETTKGLIEVDVSREWAPRGADRFFNLVSIGFYDGVSFFRVVPGFVAQAGLNGMPAVNRAWRDARIPDDPSRLKNEAGAICFATSGPNARTTQFFINLKNNSRLDTMGFAAFGRVRSADVVEQLYSGYGEGPPGGQGPQQSRIQREGRAYLEAEFPRLDSIIRARIA